MPTPLLAAKLVELRNQHGLSQLQVAEFLGMSREGYSHYERSAREPSLEAVVRLSKLYGIDVSELVNEKTALLTENIKQNKKTPQKVSGAVLPVPFMIQGAVVGPPPNITANIAHFLKLFTGRNKSGCYGHYQRGHCRSGTVQASGQGRPERSAPVH